MNAKFAGTIEWKKQTGREKNSHFPSLGYANQLIEAVLMDVHESRITSPRKKLVLIERPKIKTKYPQF